MIKLLLILASISLSANAFVTAEGFNSEIFKAQFANQPQKIKLFNYGLASFEERLEMIESAKSSIDVEYFIYRADTSGKIFTQALINRAKEGIKVRLLLDYFLIKNVITTFHADELAKYGIEVKYYNPTSTLNLIKGQYRNHRKLLIIDGQVAITGGRNIGDEYFDLSPTFNFLDRDIEITGSVAADIQATFNAVWDSEPAKKLAKPDKPIKTYTNSENTQEDDRYKMDLSNWNKLKQVAIDFISSEALDESKVAAIRAKGKEE